MEVTNKGESVLVLNGRIEGKLRQISLRPGETKEFDLIETHATAARIKAGTITVEGKAAKAPESVDGYAVAEKGKGWYVVTKDGAAVTKSLRKEDVEGFDVMSDEDKAAFVDLHKAD